MGGIVSENPEPASLIENSAIAAVKRRFMFDNSHIEEFYALFSQADTDNKGYITVLDFKKFLYR